MDSNIRLIHHTGTIAGTHCDKTAVTQGLCNGRNRGWVVQCRAVLCLCRIKTSKEPCDISRKGTEVSLCSVTLQRWHLNALLLDQGQDAIHQFKQ